MRFVFDTVKKQTGHLYLQIPATGDVFSYLVDFEAKRYELWERCVLPFTYDPKMPFFNILVPTVDTTRFGYLMDKFLDVNQSVLFTGLFVH